LILTDTELFGNCAQPMPSFTLDTNCLIDLEEGRPGAEYVRQLLTASQNGHANVAIIASMASERQLGGTLLESFEQFQHRLRDVGLGHLQILPPLARYGFSFFDFAIYKSDETEEREKEIFRALFPSTHPDWPAEATARGVEQDDTESVAYGAWRNRMCDAQALWAHEYHGMEYFVTSDKNFGRRVSQERSLAGLRIVTPMAAVERLMG
jgi:hypothetical protein